MERRKRFTLIFVLGCIGAAIAACIATAFGGIRLIYWYLGNCGDGPACSTASWLIDFWWSLFVPAAIVAALILRRIHDRRLARIANGLPDADGHIVPLAGE